MGRKHTTCEVCWAGDVLTRGIDQCTHCESEWKRIIKAYNALITRYPGLRQYSVANIFERLVRRALAAKPQ